MDTYEYVYDDAGTRPPDALPNRKVMSLREFVCCPANKETLIEEYIAKNILINPMPDAVIPKARKALVDAIKPWLRDVRPGFQAHQFQHIYNDEGSDPVQIDAIIYWTNTDAPDATGKNLQPTLFLYYAGVYYRSQLFQPHPVHGSLMPRGAFPVMRVAFAV